MSVVISPSILDYDFEHLTDELAETSSVDFVHVDIMDSHFVPSLALGLPLAKVAVKSSPVPVDVYLMIEDPDHWAPVYVELGCRSVTFHIEAAQAPIRLAREIRTMGRCVGLALRPTAGIEPYLDILGEFDMILVMTVGPGSGDQPFIKMMMPKVSRTHRAIETAGSGVRTQVGDGVSHSTIERATEAGTSNFVAGPTVYEAGDTAAEVDFSHSLASKHCC